MKTATIYVDVDRSCDMASVQTKLNPVPEGMKDYEFAELGNFHDFHPGCYANHTFGDYKGHHDLAGKMVKFLLDREYKVEIHVNNDWKYED